MWRELFRGADWLELPIVVMAAFLLMFVVVIVHVVRRGRRGGYDHVSRLPLGDDAVVMIRDDAMSRHEAMSRHDAEVRR